MTQYRQSFIYRINAICWSLENTTINDKDAIQLIIEAYWHEYRNKDQEEAERLTQAILEGLMQ